MSRTVVIVAAGSRGDVQPCVALGRGLAARGDTVRLIAGAPYEHLTITAGLEHAALSADPSTIVTSAEGQRWLAGGRNPVKFVRNFTRIIGPIIERLLDEMVAACKGADLILYPTLGHVGHHIAEHLRVPSALIHFQPSQPTGAFAHPLLPAARWLGPVGNRWSYLAIDQLTWQLLRTIIDPWRVNALDLPKLPPLGPMRRIRRARTPVLGCFSTAVVPRPRDWPSYVHVTGYWFHDEAGTDLPAKLVDFLGAGPAPVYVGFGSMAPADPVATDRTVRAALRRAGVRGVLGGSPGTSDDDVLAVDDVPHSRLFPWMAAVVHHGGAGTTAAGLRAGTPTLVCPFFGDQPYWGERVAALGAGPRPLPAGDLTEGALAEAIRRTVRPATRARAAELGRRISAEDGVARACEVIDAFLEDGGSRP